MNFQSLLKECTPVEYGDFFRLYRISNRGYVIYCNENNVICCMELYGFTDISVIMLAEFRRIGRLRRVFPACSLQQTTNNRLFV